MYKPEIIHLSSGCIIRHDLEHKSVPRDYIASSITHLWQQYEPWATEEEIRQTVSSKPGRMIDLAIDVNGNICGFYIFRTFQYGSLKVMFRGNSISTTNTRVGAQLLKLTVKQYAPDRIVAFTSQERVYAFLSHFGQILPNGNDSLGEEEWRLLSKLAGQACVLEAETLIVRDFYRNKHIRQGNPVHNEHIRYMFSQLGSRDAYALIVRC